MCAIGCKLSAEITIRENDRLYRRRKKKNDRDREWESFWIHPLHHRDSTVWRFGDFFFFFGKYSKQNSVFGMKEKEKKNGWINEWMTKWDRVKENEQKSVIAF